MPVQLKEIEEADINEVVSFHNLTYGEKRTPKQWVWEYKGNHPDSFVFTVIKDNNGIVGMQGMIPIYLNIRRKKCLSGKSENSLLNSKYRGGTLFKDLYDFAMSLCKSREMCCVWGFTSAVKVWRERLGFFVYEDIMSGSTLVLNWRRQISPILESKQDIARKIAKSVFFLLLRFYSSLSSSVYAFLKKKEKQFSAEQKLRSPGDVVALYERLRTDYADLVHIEQDKKYIDWRVFNNPNVEYATLFAYEHDLLRAYCYAALTSNGEAFLSDFTFESHEAGDFVLKTILATLRERKIASVHFVGNFKNPIIARVFELLGRHGFVMRKGFSPFVLKNISYEHEEHLRDIRNWYINGLWTEGYKM